MSFIADFLFVIVAAAIIFVAAKRGFLKTVIHFLKYVLAFAAAYLFGADVGGALGTPWISAPVKDFVYERLSERYLEAPEAFGAEQAIDALPSFLLTDSAKAEIVAAEGTGEALLNQVTEVASAPIISVFSNIFGYIVTFLLSLVALWLIAFIATKLLGEGFLFGRLNMLLGLGLGVVMSFTVLLAISSVLRFFWGDTDFYRDTLLIQWFGDSGLLRYLSFLDIGSGWLGA